MFKASGHLISISAGDTGIIRMPVEGAKLADKDRAVFTVKNKTGTIMIHKVIKPENAGEFVIPFVNADTEGMTPGNYEWDVRIVLNAKIGAGGDVVDGGTIATPFPPGQFTVCRVVGSV